MKKAVGIGLGILAIGLVGFAYYKHTQDEEPKDEEPKDEDPKTETETEIKPKPGVVTTTTLTKGDNGITIKDDVLKDEKDLVIVYNNNRSDDGRPMGMSETAETRLYGIDFM